MRPMTLMPHRLIAGGGHVRYASQALMQQASQISQQPQESRLELREYARVHCPKYPVSCMGRLLLIINLGYVFCC